MKGWGRVYMVDITVHHKDKDDLARDAKVNLRSMLYYCRSSSPEWEHKLEKSYQ
jgi:hypothetical protein